MNISATIKNNLRTNTITVSTEGQQKEVRIPGKGEGYGSSVNGGELLFLSLATCFCNDLYREASNRSMEVRAVEVTVNGAFGKEGEPAHDISYRVHVEAPDHSEEEIHDLISYIDQIAEVHTTLRKGVSVTLNR